MSVAPDTCFAFDIQASLLDSVLAFLLLRWPPFTHVVLGSKDGASAVLWAWQPLCHSCWLFSLVDHTPPGTGPIWVAGGGCARDGQMEPPEFSLSLQVCSLDCIFWVWSLPWLLCPWSWAGANWWLIVPSSCPLSWSPAGLALVLPLFLLAWCYHLIFTLQPVPLVVGNFFL